MPTIEDHCQQCSGSQIAPLYNDQQTLYYEMRQQQTRHICAQNAAQGAPPDFENAHGLQQDLPSLARPFGKLRNHVQATESNLLSEVCQRHQQFEPHAANHYGTTRLRVGYNHSRREIAKEGAETKHIERTLPKHLQDQNLETDADRLCKKKTWVLQCLQL
jgi:hypothetical protein